jgi:uncharacterized protein (DUF1697 family)
MTTYVALLRAINLGKARKVPMAELRAVLADLGHSGIATHLQSGNAVFRAGKPPDAVTADLEFALAERFGFDVPVILRTAGEMCAIAAEHPFGDDDPTKLHVVFYALTPPDAAIERIDAARAAPDRFVVRGREAYVHYPNGAGRSKLNLDPLGPGTARNWRTVRALGEMVGPGA